MAEVSRTQKAHVLLNFSSFLIFSLGTEFGKTLSGKTTICGEHGQTSKAYTLCIIIIICNYYQLRLGGLLVLEIRSHYTHEDLDFILSKALQPSVTHVSNDTVRLKKTAAKDKE